MVDFAWVTRGGVYVLIDGRYAKATSLRPASTPANLGRLETLMSLRALRPNKAEWIDVSQGEVERGDALQLAGRDFWAQTSEVFSIYKGTSVNPRAVDIKAAGERYLLLWSSKALLVQDEMSITVTASGVRLASEVRSDIPLNPRLIFIL